MIQRFKVSSPFKSKHPFPVYDIYNVLAGSGVSDGHDLVCFVARAGYPTALEITSGSKFYFTPTLVQDEIVLAMVSAISINELSMEVECSNN
jgi:hypothetical protein